MCGMCEAHMNDAVRKAVPDAKKVKSSRKKGITTFKAESIDEDALRNGIDATGYKLLEIIGE